MFKHKVQRVHLVGIGGSGMCGIAEVLLTLGYQVSGSDVTSTEVIEQLRRLGARIFLEHAASHVSDAQVVVYSAAVDWENPELAEARRLRIPLIRRAEMLAELMRLKYGVAVAGSHGKTTVTSMVGLVLAEGGLDPTMVVGGRFNNLGSHARLGTGDYLVAEADESDASFLCLPPVMAVITNIDDDHLDHYRSLDRLRAAFVEFAHKVPFYGMVIACTDDPGVRVVLPEIQRHVLTYGFAPDALLRADTLVLEPDRSTCQVAYEGKTLGELTMNIPGRHNIVNALGAMATGLALQVPFHTAVKALAAFSGVARRLQLKGESRGVRVYDDYGHHPTEVRVTLDAAKRLAGTNGGKLWVLFQPHRYTRTNLLRESFGDVFEGADGVVLTEIYAAGESPIPGVSGKLILEAVQRHGQPSIEFVAQLSAACARVAGLARKGDVVLTLGAGDVGRCGERILELLR